MWQACKCTSNLNSSNRFHNCQARSQFLSIRKPSFIFTFRTILQRAPHRLWVIILWNVKVEHFLFRRLIEIEPVCLHQSSHLGSSILPGYLLEMLLPPSFTASARCHSIFAICFASLVNSSVSIFGNSGRALQFSADPLGAGCSERHVAIQSYTQSLFCFVLLYKCTFFRPYFAL